MEVYNNNQNDSKQKHILVLGFVSLFIILGAFLCIYILQSDVSWNSLKGKKSESAKTEVSNNVNTKGKNLNDEAFDAELVDDDKSNYGTIEGEFSVNFDEADLVKVVPEEFIKVCALDYNDNSKKYCTDKYIEFNDSSYSLSNSMKYKLEVPVGDYWVYALLKNDGKNYYKEYTACIWGYSEKAKLECNPLFETDPNLVPKCLDKYNNGSEVCSGKTATRSVVNVKANETISSIHLDNNAD